MTIKRVAAFSSMSITAAIWLLKKALSIRLIPHPPMKLLAMAALASRTIILFAMEKMQGESESEDIADIAEPDVGLFDRLIPDLTQHRTKAASNKLAKNPVIVRTLLGCRSFCERYTAYGSSSLDHIFQVSITDNVFDCGKLEETPYGLEIDECYAECKELQSLNDEDLWHKVASMTIDERLTLLAHCLSYRLNLVEVKATQAYNANRRRRQKRPAF